MKDDAAIARFIQSRVVELANAAIASKGAFSMSIGSGTTVAPLVELAGEVDFTRVHLFFGNERTEGEAAGKCFNGAAPFVEACGVANVYRVPSLAAADAALQYEATVRALPRCLSRSRSPSFSLSPSLSLSLSLRPSLTFRALLTMSLLTVALLTMALLTMALLTRGGHP